MKKVFKRALLVFFIICAVTVIWQVSLKPSNDRDWPEHLAVLPYAEFQGDLVTVHNIRNFTHISATEYSAGYYDKTFDLNTLDKVYYIVEPYSKFRGAAHTFVSFQFNKDDFIAITVEARGAKNEKYDPFIGLFKQYELMYVVGDERDVIKQRTNIQKNNVYVYPVRTTTQKARVLFVDMLQRANQLKDKPAFYNTISDSCTTSIVKHVNKITPKKIPFSYKYLLPGYSDELAYAIGLLDTDLPLADAREKFLVTERAQQFGDDPDFSLKIRGID